MSKFLDLVKAHWLPISTFLFIVIGILSLIPLPQLPPAPGSDKLHHLIAYAALTLPVALCKPRYWWLIVLAYLSYSGIIELLQPYVNRYGEWLDLMANSLGIVCGLLLAQLLSFCFRSKLNASD